ncbi:MAG: KH domain-containing protein [Candidatus Woesebacteria bacterium]|jgi:predicted RNA-binding protein YlqC (UPF0109 family)
MKNLLEFLLIHILDHPEDLNIIETEEYGQTVYKLDVHPEDVARVIGKGGRKIKAIRKIAQILAVKQGISCRIDLALA